METIHILTVVDGLDDLLLVDMLGQGQLHDETIDIVVLVQLIDTSQQFSLCDVSLEADERRFETTGLAGQHLILHIGLRTTVVTHEHSCQMGLLATTGHDLLYLFGYLSLDGCCRCFSVNQLHLVFQFFYSSTLQILKVSAYRPSWPSWRWPSEPSSMSSGLSPSSSSFASGRTASSDDSRPPASYLSLQRYACDGSG